MDKTLNNSWNGIEVLKNEIWALRRLDSAQMRKEMIDIIRGKGRKVDLPHGWLRSEKADWIQTIQNESKKIEVSLKKTKSFSEGVLIINCDNQEIDINSIYNDINANNVVIAILEAFIQGQIELISEWVQEKVTIVLD